jgi:hypothetical protein
MQIGFHKLIWIVVFVALWISVFSVPGLAFALMTGGAWAFVLTPRTRAQRLCRLGALSCVACGVAIWGVSQPNVFRIARRSPWVNGLSYVSRALLNYESAKGRFPPAASISPDGRHKQSWRLEILPFLDLSSLPPYDRSQAWDSPSNLAAIEDLPTPFSDPEARADFMKYVSPRPALDETCYFAIADDFTIWEKGRHGRDDPSTTVMLIAAQHRNVKWTEPRDFTMKEAIDYLSSADRRPGWYYDDHLFFVRRYSLPFVSIVAMADGHVAVLPPLTRDHAHAILTSNGGERIDEFESPSRPDWQSRTEIKILVKWDRVALPVACLYPLAWIWSSKSIVTSLEKT